MKKRGVSNVNEERLKEPMANGTDAEGTPKTPLVEEKTTRETDIFPSVREDTGKPLPVSREPVGSGISLPEKIQEYRKNFLNRKIAVHRKQAYICYDAYRRFTRILPLLSDGMTVPVFLDNVPDHHLEVYERELDEMVRLSTQNSYQIMEHLFIYPVLLFAAYSLYKVLKTKAGRNWLRKDGALPPIQTDIRKSVRDTTYMEAVFLAEFKEHPDDADSSPDFAKMDIPENLGEALIEASSNGGIPETDAIGISVEETAGLQAGPVPKQFK